MGGLRHLPVLGQDGDVCGIITRKDLILVEEEEARGGRRNEKKIVKAPDAEDHGNSSSSQEPSDSEPDTDEVLSLTGSESEDGEAGRRSVSKYAFEANLRGPDVQSRK